MKVHTAYLQFCIFKKVQTQLRNEIEINALKTCIVCFSKKIPLACLFYFLIFFGKIIEWSVGCCLFEDRVHVVIALESKI